MTPTKTRSVMIRPVIHGAVVVGAVAVVVGVVGCAVAAVVGGVGGVMS